MKKPSRRKLAELGADRLAETLLDLADRDADVARTVARLTSAPAENVHRFRASLTRIRAARFVPYHAASGYAADLRALLADLEAGVPDPRTGVELVAAFYRADADAFESCDDSDGLVGDVFRFDARDVFTRYARGCEDKDWLVEVIADLVAADDYGVRSAVLDTASQYLPEPALRAFADRLLEEAQRAKGTGRHDAFDAPGIHWYLLVEAVARQLNDPRLFERVRRAWSPQLGVAACKDISEAWLAAGQPAIALSWLERVDPGEGFMQYEREDLLRTIHEQLGNREEVERIVWKRFHDARSAETLGDLLKVIGDDRRAAVIADAAAAILQNGAFAPGDARFLVECDRVADAADYVFTHHGRVNGDDWWDLVPLAESLNQEPLAATVVYRALLDSILARAQSRAYAHAARYLRRLDGLASLIKDWRALAPHAVYAAAVRARHGRKRSFWTRYDETEDGNRERER